MNLTYILNIKFLYQTEES